MLLVRDYVAHMANEVVKRLVEGGHIETKAVPAVANRVRLRREEVEFVDDGDTIGKQGVQIRTATLKDEEKIELEVRKRITSQKKEILEGSEEWDVPHKKYTRMSFAARASPPLRTTATA